MTKGTVFGFSIEAIVTLGNPWHTSCLLDFPETLGSFAALHRIAKHFGTSSVYLLSRVSEEAELPRKVEQGNLLGWFAFHRFTEKTGIPVSQILFCKEGEEPALCREQGITCFVGTELPVLDSLTFVATRFLFFPLRRVRPRLKQHPGVELLPSWSELIRQLGVPEEPGDNGEVGDAARTASPAARAVEEEG